MVAIAHSANVQGVRHELPAHLLGVAERASMFARGLHAEQLAWYLGLWHDLGKFHPAFQAYLRACDEPNPPRRGPDHKAAGATIAARHIGLAGLALQGHHGGLLTPQRLQEWVLDRSSAPDVADSLALARSAVVDLEPDQAISLPAHIQSDPRAAELFLRLVFSALVDADFLDTERHFRPERAEERGSALPIEELWRRFDEDQRRVMANPNGSVDRVRREVFDACLAAAANTPGLFRLTAPTGGGKTRSAMAFALRHAMQHGHERVVVAVPFITITEQTAQVYHEIFDDERTDQPIVLEHHSMAQVEDSDDYHPASTWSRLASENWDAPIVVTTTVQLFESLFSNSVSRCRKLHRLARSVIILDEAQALPSNLLTPILDVLQDLCSHYGTTVVLSTATQPAFDAIPVFARVPATEIVPEPERLFQALERVTYRWATERQLSWGEIASILREERQALAVVNTKKDALDLLDALDDPDALHLSTLLCGAHRSRVIDQVRRRLAGGEPCRLVSTQVVEAGVDIDFPLVVRAMGPLDAIVQAAGRCNREGRPERGRVVIVRTPGEHAPRGSYRTAAGVTGAMVGSGTEGSPDQATLTRYFRLLFESVETDSERIQGRRAALDYPEVASRFRMIDEPTESVVVRWGTEEQRRDVDDIVERLRRSTPDGRALMRRVQPWLVALRSHEADRYRRRGFINDVQPGLGEWLGPYDGTRGLTGEGPDPDVLVV